MSTPYGDIINLPHHADERNDRGFPGGKFVTVSGVLAKISPSERTLTMSDGHTIPIADILTISD